ncbi:MAG: LAGLIDADG family homing endonuclease [Candidatus Aenigmatarchaeota archaeon]
MDSEFGYLMGMLIAKGRINEKNSDYYISIESSDGNLDSIISRIFILCNMPYKVIERKRLSPGKVHTSKLFIVRGKLYVEKLKSYEVSTGRREWDIPSRAYISRDFRIGFLQAMFDFAGNIRYRLKGRQKCRSIRISSINSKGLESVKKLIEMEGIKSYIYKNGKTNILEIDGKNNVSIFVKKIGFTHRQKNELVKTILDPVKFDKLISQGSRQISI